MAGIDSYVKLLLHCDGADGSTTFEDKSPSPHIITAFGAAQVDTAQSVFGGAALLIPGGSGNFLSADDSPDWCYGTDNYTVDLRLRRNGNQVDYGGVIGQWSGSAAFASWVMYFMSDNKLHIGINGTLDVIVSTDIISNATWHHIALVRDAATSTKLYLDGVQTGSTYAINYDMVDGNLPLLIGRPSNANIEMVGWLDEIRISKGIARWSAPFTPPSAAYSVSAPTIVKSFSIPSIAANETSILEIAITNPNDIDITGAAFTDTYPAGLVNTDSPSGATTDPTGAVTAAPGGNSLSLSGGTIPASSSIGVTVNVTSETPGTYLNNSGNVASDNADTGTADTDTLIVTKMSAITVAKSFSPSTVSTNEESTMTITITNPNFYDVTSVSLTDIYPANLVNADTPDEQTTSTTGSLVAAAGGGSIALSGGTIPASSSITISVNVISDTAWTYNNSSGTATSDNAEDGISATGQLIVQVGTDISIHKFRMQAGRPNIHGKRIRK